MASEYGWAKRDILENTYFDELVYLRSIIEKRKLQHYLMLLAITQNPYMENPNALYRILAGEDKTVHTEIEEPYYEQKELKKEEIDKLKFAMRGNTKIKIK